MAKQTLRVGLIGAGGNTKLRHIPGLRAIADVVLAAVCNRRPESTAAVAREFDIPKTFSDWRDLAADPDIDAIVIGTWPYLHCPITLAAFEAGKHVLCEARMAMNAAEARQMHQAAQANPKLVAQLVPSPFGLKGDQVMQELITGGFLGEVRGVQVTATNASLADPAAPLSWRQDAALSGFNMLQLGIVHETLLRWLPSPIRVLAQVHAFTNTRVDPQSGTRRPVGTPDSVQALTILPNGGQVSYHLSGVSTLGQHAAITMHGTEGVLHYDLVAERIRGTNKAGGKFDELPEIAIPPDKAGAWRAEEEFVAAIREGKPIQRTDFASGVAYMEFTEAVALSAQEGTAVALPLDGGAVD